MFLDLDKKWNYIFDKGVNGSMNKYSVALIVIFALCLGLVTYAMTSIIMLSIELGATEHHLIVVTIFAIIAIIALLGKAEGETNCK